jgi:hypothetical protein
MDYRSWPVVRQVLAMEPEQAQDSAMAIRYHCLHLATSNGLASSFGATGSASSLSKRKGRIERPG